MTGVRTVKPVSRPRIRGLCRKPYPGHPRGCPNWGKRDTCPPRRPLLLDLLDLSKPVYCIFNTFDLGCHVAKMRRRHPDWSDRKLRCCLYWQGTARKQLRERAAAFLQARPECIVIYVPEATGVNVTATMASIGIQLQWPPRTVTYQVALAGTPNG